MKSYQVSKVLRWLPLRAPCMAERPKASTPKYVSAPAPAQNNIVLAISGLDRAMHIQKLAWAACFIEGATKFREKTSLTREAMRLCEFGRQKLSFGSGRRQRGTRLITEAEHCWGKRTEQPKPTEQTILPFDCARARLATF